MPIGLALGVVWSKRALTNELFKIEEERVRRLCYYGSSWLDHKGKTSSDLYPLPWEGKEVVKMDKGIAEMAAYDLQKQLDAVGGDVKKLGKASEAKGFEDFFGKR